MANFYYGRDQGQSYWINLNHVCFVGIHPDKLILKMMDGNIVGIEGEDYEPLKQIFWNQTVNWDEEYKDNDKRHNQEEVPSRQEVEANTNNIFESEDWVPSEDCDLDDEEIPI